MVVANVDKARDVLGWTAQRDLYAMCRDSWNWQSKNPKGYKKKDQAGEKEKADARKEK